MKAVPYFPLYAANMIASKSYRLMTLEQRGLWITILMECWVNGSVPSDLKDMAKYLGVESNDISKAFTNLQYAYFQTLEGGLISPELEEYRSEYMATREAQRLAGIETAKKKKQKKEIERIEKESISANVTGIPNGQPVGIPNAQPHGSLSSVNSSSINSNQLIGDGLIDDKNQEWVNDYDSSPDAADLYLRASRG